MLFEHFKTMDKSIKYGLLAGICFFVVVYPVILFGVWSNRSF